MKKGFAHWRVAPKIERIRPIVPPALRSQCAINGARVNVKPINCGIG